MNTERTNPIRVGTTEHVVRRFFDVLVLVSLTVIVGVMWWNQLPDQGDTTLAQAGIDVDSIVTIANTESVIATE